MSVWCLEAYDTESRTARSRSYTTSATTASLWILIPRIQFSDNGHGIVFHAHPHRGKRLPERRHGEHALAELARLRKARDA